MSLNLNEIINKYFYFFPPIFRSKIKPSKQQSDSNNKTITNFKLEDLFGTVSFSKDYPTKFPNTVPLAKGSIRNSNNFNHIFDDPDNVNKPNHSSASMAPRRRPAQPQVFVSNNR